VEIKVAICFFFQKKKKKEKRCATLVDDNLFGEWRVFEDFASLQSPFPASATDNLTDFHNVSGGASNNVVRPSCLFI
jgi:hypothetical protein